MARLFEMDGEPHEQNGKQDTRGDATAPAELLAAWNSVADVAGVRRAQAITGKRLTALKARLKDPLFREHWRAALEKIPGSGFLCGDNDRGWKADIDFFLRTDSVIKIMEGKYDGQPRARRITAGEQYDGRARGGRVSDF